MAERAVFTVSELTARIKGRLEDAFPGREREPLKPSPLWGEGRVRGR